MTAYAMRHGYVLDWITGVEIDGKPYTMDQICAALFAAPVLPVAAKGEEDAVLPCDVQIPGAMFRRGVKLSTLLLGLKRRESWSEAETTLPCAAPKIDTTIRDDTKHALAAIDDNIRAAAVQASTTFVGEPVAAKGDAEGWRDIYTAPKDGKSVLLDIGDTIPDCIDARVGSFISEHQASEMGETLSACGGWLIFNTGNDWFVVPFADAFGWLPLPTREGEGTP